MVNSTSPSTSPHPTLESSPPSPFPAPATNTTEAGAPQVQPPRAERKPRAPYKVAKRRPRGDLRPIQGPDEHEDHYAHRLWAWSQRGAIKRKGDGKLRWRGEDVYVDDAIRILDEEARKSGPALPGGLQGFNGGPSVALLQPSGPLPAQQPFGVPIPLQQFKPLQAQPFGVAMPLQPLESLPAQQFWGFMPPAMQQQAIMPDYHQQLQRILCGDFLKELDERFPQLAQAQQADYNPFPQPALGQQADCLQGQHAPLPQPALAQQVQYNPFPQPTLAQQADYLLPGPQSLSVEEQIAVGALDIEPVPALAQQAEGLPAQDSGDLPTPPASLPAPVGPAPANPSIFDEFSDFIIDPNDASNGTALGLDFDF